MKILVTGFTPFDGEKINPSREVVKLLPNEIGSVKIVKGLLTTAFGKSLKELEALIKTHNPDAVICVGQAGGRDCVSVEKVAVNYAQTRGYDNEGVIKDCVISKNGKTAYFTTLPVEEILTAVNTYGIAAKQSLSAGSFVCNYIMYHALKRAQKDRFLAGFIHIPYSKEQIKDKPNVFSMEISQAAKAIEIAAEVTAQYLKENR